MQSHIMTLFGIEASERERSIEKSMKKLEDYACKETLDNEGNLFREQEEHHMWPG